MTLNLYVQKMKCLKALKKFFQCSFSIMEKGAPDALEAKIARASNSHN